MIAVTTNADEMIVDGDCSLREAIHAAADNAAVDACAAGSGADTISVPTGIFEVASTLALNPDLTIQGAGRDATVLDGGDAVQIFSRTGAAGSIEIRDLSIEHGYSDLCLQQSGRQRGRPGDLRRRRPDRRGRTDGSDGSAVRV